jgi:hypothetical protein
MGTLALAVFLLVALVASLVVGRVQRDGELLAGDTIPGLVFAGEALNRIGQNWLSTQMLLGSTEAEIRTRLIEKINANSTDKMWVNYRLAISDRRDEALFKEMSERRQEYIANRAKFFELVDASRMDEARRLFHATLEPSYNRYSKAALDIFSFNVDVGKARAQRLIRLSRWTPYALAGFCVIVFLAGVFIGFKASLGAFSGAWVPEGGIGERDPRE